MKIKATKCKGIGRAKDFDGCGTPSIWRKYGLCKSCYGEWLFNTSEGKNTLDTTLGKVRRKIQKEKKEQIISYKEKLQVKINEIVRLIDIGLPCLAKGVHANQIHAGHVFSRGSNPQMKYNLHNIHRQGAQSNHFQNDDGKLRDGLIKEYGQEYYDFLQSMQGLSQLNYSNDEYKLFYLEASKIVLEIKRKGSRYNKKERIKLRNTINLRLGIYLENICVFHEKENTRPKGGEIKP